MESFSTCAPLWSHFGQWNASDSCSSIVAMMFPPYLLGNGKHRISFQQTTPIEIKRLDLLMTIPHQRNHHKVWNGFGVSVNMWNIFKTTYPALTKGGPPWICLKAAEFTKVKYEYELPINLIITSSLHHPKNYAIIPLSTKNHFLLGKEGFVYSIILLIFIYIFS